jgi:hypothetical protein
MKRSLRCPVIFPKKHSTPKYSEIQLIRTTKEDEEKKEEEEEEENSNYLVATIPASLAIFKIIPAKSCTVDGLKGIRCPPSHSKT